MVWLYNCKHDGDQYRITKFDDLMNVESSYLCDTTDCDCPAGVRPMCRHREMLPYFINRGAVGKGEFYDYDRGGWVQMYEEPEGIEEEEIEGRQIKVELDGEPTPMTDALLASPEFAKPAMVTKRSGWRRF